MPLGAVSLLYVKGGYSNGSVEVSYEDFENILDDFSLEYVHTNYNGAESSQAVLSAGLGSNRHGVLLGFVLRF